MAGRSSTVEIICGGSLAAAPTVAAGKTLADLATLLTALSGTGSKTLADVVAAIVDLTRNAATWTVYRDAAGMAGNDTTPVGVDLSTAAAVAALLTGTTKTPITVSGGSVYFRAASRANAAVSGYLVHRDTATSGISWMEAITFTLDGSIQTISAATHYVQTAGPFDVSMDAQVEIVLTAGDATSCKLWSRQI